MSKNKLMFLAMLFCGFVSFCFFPKNVSALYLNAQAVDNIGWVGTYYGGPWDSKPGAETYVYTIDGVPAYCIDIQAKHKVGYSNSSTEDALTYFTTEKGLSRSTAQDLLTRLALYDKYISSLNVSFEEQRVLTQLLTWLTFRDYGIQTNCATSFYLTGKYSSSASAVFNAARNYYNANKGIYKGVGYVWSEYSGIQPLIVVKAIKKNYDYGLDSSCVNCNIVNDDNVAYVIKDTSDWEGILNSGYSDNSNAASHYSAGGSVYCREEYTVYFPNAKDTVFVEPGRYFVINPSQEDLSHYIGFATLPNFKPVKVKKVKQCQSNLERKYKETDEAYHQRKINALKSYESSNKANFRKIENMGTVWFRYNETYENSKYNMDEPEKMRNIESIANYSSGISGETLTMTADASYTLPKEYYQYIRLSDGLSMKTPPTNGNLSTEYKNVGISNLPVSFENKGKALNNTVSKAADIQFAYDLPGNSSIGKAVSNGYMNASNCISKSSIMGSTTSGYSCMVLTNIDKDDCSSEEDANRLGVDWNPITQVCCPAGTTYNPELGKCSPNDPPGNGGGNTCKIEHGKYYDFNGNEISKEQYDKICGSDTPTCPEDECPYGCCPSGECAPMPDGTCPGLGGIDVIYRTIDLEDPFPGQNAENRNTGANWCSYNIKTQTIDCKYNNQTVKNYVTRERNNIKNGSKVYDENHILYEVTLDSQSIQRIRDYNDDNKYDDWKLTCKDNGKACISEFLNSEVDVSGLCDNAEGKDSFYACDKDV